MTQRTGWTVAKEKLAQGEHDFGPYALVKVADTRLEMARTKTGSKFNVTSRLLDRVYAVTSNGGSLEARKNGPAGISYTSAVEAVVVYLLGLEKIAGRWSQKKGQ